MFLFAIFATIKSFLGNFIPLIILCIIFLVAVAILVVCCVKKDFLKLFFGSFGVKSVKMFCFLVIIPIICGSLFSATSFLLNSKRVVINGTYQVMCNVDEVTALDGKTRLVLGDVVIDGNNYNFNVVASCDSFDVKVGNKLSFKGYFYASKLVQNGKINTGILKNNIKYYCSVDVDTLVISNGNTSVINKIKDKTKTFLLENMTKQNAGFSYAVMCGDKSLLVDEYQQIFKNSGLAHILAVSGLHIGFLVAIINFILKLFKLKGKYRFIITGAILLIYNIMCQFAPSVFRASVMSLCLMLGLIVGERNDTISNISLAGIIVLLFQPLYLFDVGFLLSFGSVFGIILFANCLNKLLQKIKFPKFLANSISVTTSATIGTIPWICMFFNEFAPISLLSNLIVLPLFSIMFTILLLCSVANLLFNLPVLITFAQFFVNIVVSWSALFAKFGTISTLSFDVLSAIVYYFVAFIASPYFMVKPYSKGICVLCLFVSFCTALVNCNTATIINKNQVFTTQNTKNMLFFTTKAGKTIISNIDYDTCHLSETTNMLKQNKITHIDYLLLYNYTDSMQHNVCQIAKNFSIATIYIFGDIQNSTKIGLADEIYSSGIVNYAESNAVTLSECNFYAEGYKSDGYYKAVKYRVDDVNVLQLLYFVSEYQIKNNIFFKNTTFDCVFVNKFNKIYLNIPGKMYVSKNSNDNDSNVYLLADGEVFTYAN
jgi:ComEC/Rec2-related protein